jgi:gluconate 2-dehydrogenase gamma chain
MRATPSTLANAAYSIVRRRLMRGQLSLGQAVSRRKLAAELGMSFLPVSEALLRLEVEGLLESRPRAGTRVRIPSPDDVRGHYVVRESLETQAARLFSEKASTAERVSLQQLGARVDRMSQDEDRKQYLRLHYEVSSQHRRRRPLSRAVGRHRTDQCALVHVVLRFSAAGRGARTPAASGSGESAGRRYVGDRRGGHAPAHQMEPARGASPAAAVFRAPQIKRPDVFPKCATGRLLSSGSDEQISRRELLKRAGAVGAVAFVPVAAVVSARTAFAQGAASAAGVVREPLETLTSAEADVLEAICARLIPTDANGPGAAEARAAHYIDRALGGALQSSRQVYATGLAALDSYATSSRGSRFPALAPADQDRVLQEVATGSAGFPNGVAFFNLVRTHTVEGTFGDPSYGGNAGFVGWDLIGYPGVRTVVTADEQRLGAGAKPNHKSAYDYTMFTKASP